MIKPAFWRKTDHQIQIYDSSFRSELEKFCQKAFTEIHKSASDNMAFEKLIQVIEVEDRFRGGEFLLFKVQKEIVAVSGYHPYDLDQDSFVCGVRTYTLSEFEHFGIHSNFMLPYQLNKVFEDPERQALLVFNDYNEKIYHFVESLVSLLNKRLDFQVKQEPLPKKINYKNTVQFGVLIYHKRIRLQPFEKSYI